MHGTELAEVVIGLPARARRQARGDLLAVSVSLLEAAQRPVNHALTCTGAAADVRRVASTLDGRSLRVLVGAADLLDAAAEEADCAHWAVLIMAAGELRAVARGLDD